MLNKRWEKLFALLIVGSMILTACGGSSDPEVVEKEVTRVVQETVIETVKETVIVEGTPQVVEQEVTKVVEVEKVVTATPELEAGPAVGGKLVIAWTEEPDTMDVQRGVLNVVEGIAGWIGGTLVTKDPLTNETIPYLAESWTISDDGLTWEFKLREDVKFHDGTPLTAHEWAWTFQRALDPETMSAVTGAVLTGLASAEAVDDYTLRLNMFMPNFPLLDGLAHGFLQPLNPSYVEEMGDDYGRHPMGVGPYIFKEWATGEKIVMERNPDFNWGPAYSSGNPPYIETIEHRFIVESTIIIAGLETGELDLAWVRAQDVVRVEETGQFQIIDQYWQGSALKLWINVERPWAQDIRVRQALNLAVDQEALITVVLRGKGVPQYGPITPATDGYWPGVEYISYGFDLEKAQALMAKAGYTPGADGILEKDGERLELNLLIIAGDIGEQVAQVVQEMFKQLGVGIDIELLEIGAAVSKAQAGEFDLHFTGNGWTNAGLMWGLFNSNMIGMFNMGRISDPELDAFTTGILAATDQEAYMEASADTQRRMVEQAYLVYLYEPISSAVLSNKVQGVEISPITGAIILNDAYIETSVP